MRTKWLARSRAVAVLGALWAVACAPDPSSPVDAEARGRSDAAVTGEDAARPVPADGGTITGADTGADAARRDDAAAIDFTPGVVPADAPDWVASLTPGTWSAISTNTLADLDPEDDPDANPAHPGSAPWRGNEGQSGVIDDWCGGALAYGLGAHGSLLVWGGGHAGYYGNEIYAFDLGTRTWSRLSDPYPTPVFDDVDAYPTGFFPDGSPVVPHTTDRVEYHPGTHSFVTLEVEQNNFGGYTTSTPAMFSLDRRQWRRSPTSPEHLWYMGWSAYDSTRELLWTEGSAAGGANPMSSFDPTPANADGTYGAWAQHVPQVGALGAMGAYDPLDDAILVTSFRSGTDIFGIDPASPSDPAVTIAQGGDVPPDRHEAHGWEWSATRESFVFWAGGHVYELARSDGGADWRTATWAWVDITNPASTTVPEYASNGVFGRFRIARYGDVEVAITVGSTTGPVHAFRLPE
jgi:hypothetical protein